MRIIQAALLALLVATTVASAQTLTDPGWFNAQRSDGAPQPDTSWAPQPTDPPEQSEFMPLGLSGPYPIAETITPEIQALARGLENDPVRIYNYVHDYIGFVLYFGSKKGAQLTLLEKRGNDFDQCALLVALLRAAGYSPQYQFGWMGIPYDAKDGTENDLHHWLGLNFTNTNWQTTSNYLVNLFWGTRGYPDYYFVPNDTNTFVFQRVWVTLNQGGTTYYLDPGFKPADPIAGISLPSALGFSSSSSLSNALMSAAGGTATSTSVSGINEANLRNALTGYTTNLLNYLQSNCPNSEVSGVLGGWGRYVDYWDETALPQRLLFHTYYWDYPGVQEVSTVTWNYEPTNLMSTLAITFAGTNYQLYMPQLQGQRLALTFDSGGTAQLWQDDSLLAQGSTGASSGSANVVLAVNHPFGNWDWVNNTLIDTSWCDMSVTNSYQSTNATYALLYAFEPNWAWLRERQNLLDSYRQQGLADTSRQVVSETLNVMGLSWMLESEWASYTLEPQLGILPQYHHRLGRMAQETGHGYYVDAYMQISGFFSRNGVSSANQDQMARHLDLACYFGSALEHGIVEQLQAANLVGASTVKMLEVANTNGQTTYLANSANWTSGANVRGHLPTYGADLSTLDRLISSNYYLFLPQNGSNHVAGNTSWAGYGYVAHLNSGGLNGAQFAIAGGYHGGYVSDPTATANPTAVVQSGQAQPPYFTSAPLSAPVAYGADPVNVVDAAFEVQNTDLSLGQPEPRGLCFSRFYSGRRRYSNPAGLAPGWVHNYYANVVEASAPEAGLGSTTPAQMAPMLAATCAAVSLYNQAQPNPKNWMVTTLIAKWAIDQLSRNGVSVTLGHDTLQFVKQPDGRFTPPANCTSTLTRNGTYALQERHGRSFNFDSLGRLATIVDPYTNVSLSISYQASNWVQSVTDWKGRSLAFTYSGSPQRLTQVADNSTPSRTVTFGYANTYSSQGDLVSVTDPENQTSGYAYDANHLMTATVDALGRMVVSNIYDGMGRVATQYTQGDTNKTWQIYWSGFLNVIKDPAGGRQAHYYDIKSRQFDLLDELGGWHDTFYDGQDHIIWSGTPLYEYTGFVYDANHNVIQKIDPLGYTNQFIYDTQNNLVRSIDPRGNTNFFGYNAQFSLTGSTNGAGNWLTYAYNTDGTLHSRADSAGSTLYGYDSYGQVSSVTYPGGLGSEGFLNSLLGDVLNRTNARSFVTSFQYNNRRELTNTITPTNLTVKVFYDAADNVKDRTDARGFTTTSFWSPTRHLTGAAFPATSQGTPTTTNVYDSRDWLVRSVDVLQNPTLFANDPAGHLLSRTDPLLRTTRFGYDADGHQTAATNAALEVTLQQWDARGQMTQLTDPATHTVGYAFDAAGNQVFLTNRNGKIWQFQFDRANRLTNTITPRLASTKSAYNDRGLLQSLTQPSQRVTTFGYDARGRKTSRADLVGTTTYQYDGNNNLTNVFENGKTNSWTFDAYDRVSSYRDSAGNLLQYRYDAGGNVTNLVYPGNRNVSYAFDSLNRLTNVTDWVNRQTTLSYDLAGRLTSITRPNGTVRSIGYDAAGQATNIVEKTTTGFPIAFFRFNWDNAARVQWEFAAPLPTHTNALPSRSMCYDADNRLTNVNGQIVRYDLDGNMTNGPATNGTLTTYVYDARNRPSAIGTLQYGYDPAGNRTALTNGGALTRFVVNPNAKLPQVLMRVQGGVTNYYIYGPGLLYEISETATSTNTLTYHYDYRGSTIALSGSDGSVRERFEYSAYGLLNYRSGSTDTPFLYNGRFGVQSDANGLLYMRARYYNPYICRFIHADPSGFSGGLNLYAYADGNPVSYVDPFGLDAVGADTGHSLLDNTLNGIDRFDGWVADKGLNLLGRILSGKSGGGREGPSLQMLLGLGVLIASRGESALATAESMESVAAESTALRFSQTTASPWFSSEGTFAGQTISDVAGQLRAGSLSAADVPVQVVTMDGNTLIVNTRSSLALSQAGIPQSSWNLIDMTGNANVVNSITTRLGNNGLTTVGTSTLRITGSGSGASTYFGSGTIPRP